ncbi:neurocan core protein-like [Amphiura filiformis]|uniref:neurocan core protein-like n=1 Tax=Amphiura filiformis TaxID=82378 RepID=UPI003B222552
MDNRNINECASSPCLNRGTCRDGVNQYTCNCVPGYNGLRCERNINECGSSPCSNGGTCRDGVNQYTCDCVPGYNGLRCERPVCQIGWHYSQGNCYIYVSSITRSWSGAETYCSRVYGANLVSIHSSEEQSFVKELITESALTWIGLNDRTTEDSFKWSDGTQNDYNYWNPGEPNNAHDTEDCVAVLTNSASMKWNDVSCTLDKRFVCKK